MAAVPRDALQRGERWRAPYGADPARSRGRLHPEAEDPLRSPFQRDRDRIIHSNAFRRLMHKTQVFVHHEGDHFRTRLTHTLEVAQVARSIARPLGLDEDLAEALALAHDLGHPPFGHAGERALDAALESFDGFDHNAQSLRVVTALERRYPSFDGLNLTWETLEGIVKHNGPLVDGTGRPLATEPDRKLPYAVRVFREVDLQLDTYPSLEAQVAAISDDIAYASHDVQDGLRAGLLTLAELEEQPITGPLLALVDAEHPGLEPSRRRHELVRRMITVLIADAIAATGAALEAAGVGSVEDVRRAGKPLAQFSAATGEAADGLKRFLLDNLYRHPTVMRPVTLAEAMVGDLFEAFTADPGAMPEDWARGLDPADAFRTARRVADYIAGMTDRYAIAEHERLFDATPDLR